MITDDKKKEKARAKKKKMRKAYVKGVSSAIKSTLFPSKESREARKGVRKYKREIKKEFGLKKGGSVKTKKK